MNRRGLLSIILRLALALGAAAAVAFAVRPDLRAAFLAEMNDPAALPALEKDPRIHYQPPARACADDVAALLPAAMQRIETVQGRAFTKAPIIGVYDSYETYAHANGLNDSRIAAVMRAGRVLLSPTLCREERARLEGVLTHELSHVQFFGARPRSAPRPPAWFTEGLAVMASNGGGAESVSDAQARQALRDGSAVVLDAHAWTDFAAIRFVSEPVCASACDRWTYRQRLAYRQAALFVAWLGEQNPQGFMQLLRNLETGDEFENAFAQSFGDTSQKCWSRFVAETITSRSNNAPE